MKRYLLILLLLLSVNCFSQNINYPEFYKFFGAFEGINFYNPRLEPSRIDLSILGNYSFDISLTELYNDNKKSIKAIYSAKLEGSLVSESISPDTLFNEKEKNNLQYSIKREYDKFGRIIKIIHSENDTTVYTYKGNRMIVENKSIPCKFEVYFKNNLPYKRVNKLQDTTYTIIYDSLSFPKFLLRENTKQIDTICEYSVFKTSDEIEIVIFNDSLLYKIQYLPTGELLNYEDYDGLHIKNTYASNSSNREKKIIYSFMYNKKETLNAKKVYFYYNKFEEQQLLFTDDFPSFYIVNFWNEKYLYMTKIGAPNFLTQYIFYKYLLK